MHKLSKSMDQSPIQIPKQLSLSEQNNLLNNLLKEIVAKANAQRQLIKGFKEVMHHFNIQNYTQTSNKPNVVLVLSTEDFKMPPESPSTLEPYKILCVQCRTNDAIMLPVESQRILAEWAGLISSNSSGIEKAPKCTCLGIKSWDINDEKVKLLLSLLGRKN